MRFLFFISLFLTTNSFAQKLSKADKSIVANLKTSISYLADDKLEGRRAGTPGEKLAITYITSQFQQAGLSPKGAEGFQQSFEINDGKEIGASAIFSVNGQELKKGSEFFPLAFSPNSGSIEAVVSLSLSESGQPWFKDLGDVLMNNKDNPHFDINSEIQSIIKNAATKGAKALIFYNSSNLADNVKFDPRDKMETAAIPVFYLMSTAREKYLKDLSADYDITLKSDLAEKKRTASNVIGYIDNGAASTIVFGAHFDHLGYGEDGNSMLRNGSKEIHNGADDNASGTAALMELAKLMKKSKSKQNNYLFIAFSGEELGLFGSKYFVEHPTINLTNVNYMINMDMVGRLNDSTKTVTIGGYGTSPAWNNILSGIKKLPFTVRYDSSGTGPSDHTSFYRKDIPVLFFFTGLHTDYHKPGDDADKINYNGELQIIKYITAVVDNSKSLGKLAFTKTREQQTGTAARFSVSMGIMPDYTFSGSGVRVDGVTDGRAAQKAGLKTGDVVVQLGEHKINSMETYMQGLSKFKKGDSTTVKVKRGAEELTFDIVF
ncbi:M20/M25/M40 family metallo-hydrolase [Pollutibacter soli]|uniref:M20/M25/M40 family metallo-hydrolase n=1 Tax=Pollutibacter soli TaxID=3034157 RepID=UPI003013FD90